MIPACDRRSDERSVTDKIYHSMPELHYPGSSYASPKDIRTAKKVWRYAKTGLSHIYCKTTPNTVGVDPARVRGSGSS